MRTPAASILLLAAGLLPCAQAQNTAPPAAPAPASVGPASEAELQALIQQLDALKRGYAQEVRRLRDLDMQVQALQARIQGRVPAAPAATPQQGVAAAQPAPAPQLPAPLPEPPEGYAGTAEQARAATEVESRSVEDVKQQHSALFNRRLTLESGLTYNRYDRKQLTLTGFLALDAIFLGNIAIENVESDTLTYNLALRYGLNPRLSLNLDVPFLGRRTVYQKGGAGGAAAAIAQEDTDGYGLGDVTVSASYRMLQESGRWPETVLTGGVTAPTGREPYGIAWTVLERDDDGFIRFAVPDKEPTGSGAWQANLGVSMIKTADPAILFANFGVIHPFEASFDDLDNNPETVNPGDVRLGRSFYFGAGVAFAFNERTSLSISFSDRLTARARTRYEGEDWVKVIGSDANSAMFNLGVTYAVNPKTTFVGQLGIGLTPDAPDFSLIFKLPYAL